jgi:hypothetical protein
MSQFMPDSQERQPSTPPKGPEEYLSPDERKFIQRYLSFPEDLPPKFRSWVVDQTVTNASQIQASQIAGLDNTLFTSGVVLQHGRWTASSVATDLAAVTHNAVDDPLFRTLVNLRGAKKCRLLGRLGGTVATATKIRVQYHAGKDPLVASGDAGWQALVSSAGSHVAGTSFWTAEGSIPSAARRKTIVLRPVIYDGDGVADPTLTIAILHIYA